MLASGLPSSQLDLNAFLRQGQEYHEWDSAWDRLSRRVTELNLTHSYPVGRVAELTAWVRSGDYDRIVGGSYRKRDEKVDAVAEADAAYRHYRERFQRIIAETSDTLAKVPDRMADWLRKAGAAARDASRSRLVGRSARARRRWYRELAADRTTVPIGTSR